MIKVEVHHYFHPPQDEAITQKLDKIISMIEAVQRKEEVMSKELDALTVQVQENTEVEASAVVLLQGLAAQIADLKDDPVALQALSDTLNASADNLAAAVTANTPAE
jgi:hypothetical protein